MSSTGVGGSISMVSEPGQAANGRLCGCSLGVGIGVLSEDESEGMRDSGGTERY
jgi:hypothetical protein